MKTRISIMLVILLVLPVLLLGCSGNASASAIVKKQLTSGPWTVDMSEGTTAVYTFEKNGEFTCNATAVAGDQTADLSRSGTYEVKEENGAVRVFLQYPKATYQVEITCNHNGEQYDFIIAGCPMYQA